MEEKENLWGIITKLFTKYNREKIENLIKSRNQYREMFEANISQLIKLCRDSQDIVEMVRSLHDIKFKINNSQNILFGRSSGSSGGSISVVLENNLKIIREYLTTMLEAENTRIIQDVGSTPENIITSMNSLLKNCKFEYTKIPDSNLARIKIINKK